MPCRGATPALRPERHAARRGREHTAAGRARL